MTEISMYDLAMLIWLDEMGYDRCDTVIVFVNYYLLVRGIRYTAIPVISMEGVHDVYLHQGNMNGDSLFCFVEKCLLPILLPFNWHNLRSVVILDNASIHHVQEVKDSR